MEQVIRVGIVTASDRGAAGERKDESGEEIRRLVAGIGGVVAAYRLLPDEQDQLSAALIELADREKLDLILTTGGTGFSPRDRTPEATARVIERSVPGLPEAMRQATLAASPFSMLSRGIAGIRGTALIVNLPGSPKGVRECLSVILPVLPHAVAILHGGDHDGPGDERHHGAAT